MRVILNYRNVGERETEEETGEIMKAAILTLLHSNVVGTCLRGQEEKLEKETSHTYL
jgi:hypothetical protein